jgi:outer membrane protein assembly factor BamB
MGAMSESERESAEQANRERDAANDPAGSSADDGGSSDAEPLKWQPEAEGVQEPIWSQEDSEATQVATADPEAMWPPRTASILILAGAITSVLVQSVDITGDRAANNILALIGIAVAVGTLLTWSLRNPAFPLAYRRVGLALLLILLMAAVAVVRIDQVTGDMVPSFRFVWTPSRDARMVGSQAPEGQGGSDLISTTPIDFPQFLGPDRNGIIESLQLEPDWRSFTPRMVWKQPIGAGWSGFAAVNGYAVTMEQRGEEEWVSCYRADTGELQWGHRIQARHETTLGGVGPRSTPTIHEGRVLALGATGVLRCLDGADGSLIWSRDLLEEFGVSVREDMGNVAWGRAASPLVVDSWVVVPAGGPRNSPVSLVSYDLDSGVEAWRAGSSQIGYSSPIVAELHGTRQIIMVNEDTVSGHHLDGGEVLWTYPWPGSSTGSANTSQPSVIEDEAGTSVFVSKGYGQGVARFLVEHDASRDTWATRKLYESAQVLKTKMTSAVVRYPHAFGLSDGILECIDLRDGRRLWKRGRYGHGQILLVGDHLLVLGESGELFLVEAVAEEHRELHQIPVLQGKTWNTLCLHGDLLLIRNGEEAACYQLAFSAGAGTSVGGKPRTFSTFSASRQSRLPTR